MAGWLGNQYGPTDRFLPGLLVVWAEGIFDAAFGPLGDPWYLRQYGAVVRDWQFPGGHEMPTDMVRREALAWLIDQRKAPGPDGERRARALDAAWRSALAEGKADAVFRECMATILGQPRTWEAHLAHRVIDDMMASFDYFKQVDLTGFASGSDATDFFYFRAIGDGKLSVRSGKRDAYHSAIRALAHVGDRDPHRGDNVLEVMARYGVPTEIESLTRDATGNGLVLKARLHAPEAAMGLESTEELGGERASTWVPWDSVPAAPPTGPGQVTVAIPATDGSARFFRARATLPPTQGWPRNTTGTVFP